MLTVTTSARAHTVVVTSYRGKAIDQHDKNSCKKMQAEGGGLNPCATIMIFIEKSLVKYTCVIIVKS